MARPPMPALRPQLDAEGRVGRSATFPLSGEANRNEGLRAKLRTRLNTRSRDERLRQEVGDARHFVGAGAAQGGFDMSAISGSAKQSLANPL